MAKLTVLDQVIEQINSTRALETIDVAVPHIDGLFLRCARVMDEDSFLAANQKYADRPTDLKAWIIAKTCVGIFVEEADGRKVGLPPGQSEDPANWPRFDRDLDLVLPDLPDGASAIDRVKALFGAGVHPDGRASVMVFGMAQVVNEIADLHGQFGPKA